MSGQTFEGIYREGRIELLERPAGIEESTRVLVTFPDAPNSGGDNRRDAAERLLDRLRSVSEDEAESMRRAAFEEMERGIDLGGPPYPKRDELYDRFR